MKWLTELGRLQTAWEAQEPKRVRGGYAALAGFHFQLSESLLQRVETWCSLPADRRPEHPAIFDELLSDAVDATGDSVIITQSKQVLRSSSLRDALEELWKIDRLAAGVTPELASRLFYRVTCRESTVADFPTAVGSWRPQESVDEKALSVFRRRVELRICPHPLSELMWLLATRLNAADPLDCARNWIGRLLEDAPQGRLTIASKEIWNDLWKLQRARDERLEPQERIELWSDADVPPLEVRRGEFLTGQMPSREHLQKGFFAPRPHVYEPLADHVESWLASHEEDGRYGTRIPTFWIGGRSGAGKSVALLHVASLLHARRVGRVLWLGSDVRKLLAAARYAVRQAPALAADGRRVIAVLDDPYAPGEQASRAQTWSDALEIIQATELPGAAGSPLVVLCCGPTEQAERFRSVLSEHVDVRLRPLEREHPEELDTLRTWFRMRTDREPVEVVEDNFLLVQVLFQWSQEQSLREFADRLRRRMRAWGADGEAVFSFLCCMLAVNRLYVGLPPGALDADLTGAQRDIYERLRAENHLTEDRRNGRSELWLAHPHLANIIYNDWFDPEVARNERGDHLAAAVRTGIVNGRTPGERTAVLWGIAQALASSGGEDSPQTRLDHITLPALLRHAWGDCNRLLGNPLPTWAYPAWVTLAAHCPAARLAPSVVGEALTALRAGGAQGEWFQEIGEVLLQHAYVLDAPLRLAIYETIAVLLREQPKEPRWGNLLLGALRRGGGAQVAVLAYDWASGHPRHPVVPALFPLVFETLNGTEGSYAHLVEGYRTMALSWLRATRVHASWQLVWKALWHDGFETDALRQIGTQWLMRTTNAAAASWVYLWEDLWKGVSSREDRHELEKIGLAWLAKAPGGQRFWKYVWRALRKSDADPGTLRKLALTWLQKAPVTNPSFSSVWEVLWKERVDRTGLRAYGYEWLRAHIRERDLPWPYIWRALWVEHVDREPLRALAVEWLARDSNQNLGWPYVWRDLWREGVEDRASLARLAVPWLGYNRMQHRLWSDIWIAVNDAGVKTDALRVLGRTWLQDHAGDTTFVLWIASRVFGEREEPGDPAADVAWLADLPREARAWPHVWKLLWRRGNERETLHTLVLEWLERTRDVTVPWESIWKELWNYGEDDADLVRLGLRWLAEAKGTHPAWPHLWERLWVFGAEPGELTRQGLVWLAQEGGYHSRWPQLWGRLYDAGTASAQLHDLGLRWLRRARGTPAAWYHVWKRLWDRARDPSALYEPALAWLATAPPDFSGYSSVWKALWHSGVEIPELRRLGFTWLAAVDRRHKDYVYVSSVIGAAGSERFPANTVDGLRVADQIGTGEAVWSPASNTVDWVRIADFDHPAWPRVWQTLWRTGSQRDELRLRGVRWLRFVAEMSSAWPYIWKLLWDEGNDNAELRKIGLSRMGPLPSKGSFWPSVWACLWNDMELRDSLVDAGLAWVTTGPGTHRTWPLVWQLLYAHNPTEPLREHGARWLEKSPVEHPMWSSVWERLWENGMQTDQLRARGMAWLEAAESGNRRWQMVWSALWNFAPSKELQQLGVKWLSRAEMIRPSWLFVWRPLWDLGEDCAVIAPLGQRWLSINSGDLIAWPMMWQTMWDFGHAREVLRASGIRWLEAIRSDQRVWAHVWKRLWDAGDDRPRVGAAGVRWLRAASEHPSWRIVFCRLIEGGYEQDLLLQIGLGWLEGHQVDHPGWETICATIGAVCPTPEVERLVERWFAETGPEDRVRPIASRASPLEEGGGATHPGGGSFVQTRGGPPLELGGGDAAP